MINPMQILQMVSGGANPQQVIMQAAQQNPAIRQAMQIVNGRTPNQIRDMAMNMAKQQGIDLNVLARNMGIKLPK